MQATSPTHSPSKLLSSFGVLIILLLTLIPMTKLSSEDILFVFLLVFIYMPASWINYWQMAILKRQKLF